MVLAKVEIARRALAEARTIEEVWDIRDQASAILKVLKSQRDSSFEAQNYAAEIKIRAERKLGDMLKAMEKNEGEAGRFTGGNIVLPPIDPPPPTYADLDIDKMAASRWQAIASIPEERFEEYIANVKEAQEELTSASMHREARRLLASERRRSLAQEPLPAGIFDVVLADPPWPYDNQIASWGPTSLHYDIMTMDDIISLGPVLIPHLADNATLFLWVTNPFLAEGLEVAEAWDFEYKTNVVWIKTALQRPGSGFYVRGRHELLFICTRGSHIPQQQGQEPIGSVLMAPVREHSRKPEETYALIDAMYPAARRLELFQRGIARENWTVWGEEANVSDK